MSLDSKTLPATGALILAVVILIASLVIALLPKPNIDVKKQNLSKQIFQAQLNYKTLNQQSSAENAVSVSQTWAGSGDEIGPTAYANLYKLANDRNVKIVGFRPQRPVNAGDLTQLPYVVNVTGAYKNVLDFVHAIETTPTKLAVELFQLGSSDESSDNVTGTIGVEAYVLNAVATPSATTTKKKVVTTTTTTTSTTPSTGPKTVISAKEKTSNGR